MCPEKFLGGLTTQGLGWTDTGDNSVIGGLSRDFYARIKHAYDDDAALEAANQSQLQPTTTRTPTACGCSKPHVAEELFEALVVENALDIRRDEWLDREGGVEKTGARIGRDHDLERCALRRPHLHRRHLRGRLDGGGWRRLTTVGREANATYGETLNGIEAGAADGNQFTVKVLAVRGRGRRQQRALAARQRRATRASTARATSAFRPTITAFA